VVLPLDGPGRATGMESGGSAAAALYQAYKVGIGRLFSRVTPAE
jgi:hypothetical protein